MIKLLAKIGRFNTVIITTLIAVATSLAATMAAAGRPEPGLAQ